MAVRRRTCLYAALVALAAQAAAVWSLQAEVSDAPELDAGFHLLYDLKPEEARAKFAVWKISHPEDPLGSAAEAASYLFEECYRQGVLTSEFFLDNKRFLDIAAIQPDPELRDAFFAADLRGQTQARVQLAADPDDKNALFAMTISLGMQAGLRQSDREAPAGKPEHDTQSRHVCQTTAGRQPRRRRCLPHSGRRELHHRQPAGFQTTLPSFQGDRRRERGGIRQLVSRRRRTLPAPFAKMLLALAALREKKISVARIRLTELAAEFPENPLFAGEMAKLDARPDAGSPGSAAR